MDLREFLAKRKTHLIFVGAFILVLCFNIITSFTAGQTLLGAAWSAISEIRPMDYLMFLLFWYACAAHRSKDDWETPLIALNLSQTSNQK